MRAFAVVAVFFAAAPEAGVAYVPPVEAEVVDPFRAPVTPYGRGNRGIDYATEPGTPVTASAPGVVAFAGPVGDSLHVTVLHPDGVRTSYSFVQSVSVRRGDRVDRGQELARAGPSLHFGARLGNEYLDPRLLLGGARPHARLVPDEARRPAAEARERWFVQQLLRSLAPVRAAAAATQMAGSSASFGADLAATLADTGPCTPPDRAPPAAGRRRIVVLVAGFGSTSASAAVEAVDTRALGYAPGDVHRFSYRGGTVAERPYGARDSAGDLRGAGERLAALLRRLSAAAPGVPVDVVAHSQGGLVARWALSGARPPPAVEHLVTLGTPHQGADLAADALAAAREPTGKRVLEALRRTGVTQLDPHLPALRQLAPRSTFLRDLARRPRPPRLRVTSVAARHDAVVASPRSRLAGARNVVVTMAGHARLPGSSEARREIALAVGGLPPTCRSRADAAADLAAGHLILEHHRLLGRGLPLSPVPAS